MTAIDSGEQQMTQRLGIILASTILITLAVVVFISEEGYEELELTFPFNDSQFAAVLTLPKKQAGPFPVVIFVHGDGALPSDAYGYYKPLWNRLAKRGVASFSWDKAGVGGSSGDWLSQSMDDRADEVIAAVNYLKTREEVNADAIGLIGFSQAGWVLPLVATKSPYPDFMVIVSGAINWADGSDYQTRNRLSKLGVSAAQIEQAIMNNHKETELLKPEASYHDYLDIWEEHQAVSLEKEPMSEAFFEFVKLNWHYDARDNLKDIDMPVLAVFGEEDINVDAAESAAVYQREFEASGHSEVTIKTFPNAQHSLLKSRYFQALHPGVWFWLKLELLGEAAFAEGYLEFVTEWIVERSSEHHVPR